MGDDYSACPRCRELTQEGDHFPTADGAAYHVLCYQAAMLDAGQPNPFPLCDYCEQLVWETSGPGELVIKHSTFEKGAWRPGRWHRECAPGEESIEYVKDTPVERPDRVDQPPPQPQPRGTEILEVPAATGAAVPAATRAAEPADGPPICARCEKPIQRSLRMIDAAPYHKLCAEREEWARARAAKRARRAAPKTPKPRVLKPKCFDCKRSISTSVDGIEPIECESDGTVVHYHKRCYRKAAVAAGMPDPFPPPAKVVMFNCSFCKQDVPREHVREHVAAHEAANWDGTAQ